MEQLEAIKKEIESEFSLCERGDAYNDGRWAELSHIKLFIESLEKEQESKSHFIKAAEEWIESMEQEQFAGETMMEKDKIDTAFTRMMEKEPKDVFDDHLSELITNPINIPPISEDAEIVEDSAHLGIPGESM